MAEYFETDAGYTLIVHEGFDRDGELYIEVDNNDTTMNLYMKQSDVIRLRNTLSAQLGTTG